MTDVRLIGIDEAHCSLIYGLVVAQKPHRVLEFGYGLGNSFRAIQNGLKFNENGAVHVLVDDWSQWSGQPQIITSRHSAVELNTCTEEEYMQSRRLDDVPFDFIVSDADHEGSAAWFRRLILEILAPRGIAVFHDVTNADTPRLWKLIDMAQEGRYPHRVFNQCSRSDEHCERGLLVIFKP